MYNGVYTIEQYAYMHDTLMKWLRLEVGDENLGDRLVERGINQVAIYGANELGELVGEDILKCSGIQLESFVDKNASLHGCIKCGVEVIAPEEAISLSKECCILVVPEYYFKDILDSLVHLGIPMERVISLSMIVG